MARLEKLEFSLLSNEEISIFLQNTLNNLINDVFFVVIYDFFQHSECSLVPRRKKCFGFAAINQPTILNFTSELNETLRTLFEGSWKKLKCK